MSTYPPSAQAPGPAGFWSRFTAWQIVIMVAVAGIVLICFMGTVLVLNTDPSAPDENETPTETPTSESPTEIEPTTEPEPTEEPTTEEPATEAAETEAADAGGDSNGDGDSGGSGGGGNDDDDDDGGGSVYYENCDAVRDAGADPIYAGDPGYGSHLDRDGDGVGCE